MPNILFIETASDQVDIIKVFRSAAISANFKAFFLFKNKNQLKLYKKNGIDGSILNTRKINYKKCSSWLLEKNSRYFGSNILVHDENEIEQFLDKGNFKYIFCYVGPEALKSQFRIISKRKKIPFYFLDQTIFGNKYIGNLPFSISKPKTVSGKLNKADYKYESLLNSPKKNRYTLQGNVKNYMNDGFSRLLESVYSYLLRIFLKVFINNMKKVYVYEPKKINILIAPQSFTEAAFGYGSKYNKSPISQLLHFIGQNYLRDQFKVSMRLHPQSGDRMKFSDLIKIIKSGVELRAEEPIEQAFKTCDAILTINSNIGFEALKKEKKVIALGNAYYSCLPDVVCPTEERINQSDLDRIKENFSSNISNFENALKTQGLKSNEWNFSAFSEVFKNLTQK